MARTLDANLQAAQDGQSHRPIVEIVSSQREADIPFDGTLLTSLAEDEYGQNIIAHSTGRLALLYIAKSEAHNVLRLAYTDMARTEFTYVDLHSETTGTKDQVACSLCELTGGNLGIVVLVNDQANHLYRLHRYIFTVTGTAISNAEVAYWSHDTFTSDPWVQTVGANSYLLVYAKASGSNHYLYKRSSSDFTTWSAESALSIGGLTSTWKLRNPSIIKISSGDLWLWFDVLESTGPGGEELTNIYFSVSSDGGGTWANAVKVTAYDSYGEVGSHPVAIQKAANQMHLIFTLKRGALHMEDTASGWPTGDCTTELSWDSVNRKLYAVNASNNLGTKNLQCIVKIDVDSWTVDQYWDSTTSPGFPAWICDKTHHVWYDCRRHDGHLIVMHAVGVDHRAIFVLDGEANTIREYYFNTDAEHGFTANVSGLPSADYRSIDHLHLDAASQKLWVFMVDSYLWHPKLSIGYLDLTEASDYQYHEVVASYNTDLDGYVTGGFRATSLGGFWYDADNGYLICTAGTPGWAGGYLFVFDASTGGLLYRFDGAGTDPTFPYYGLRRPFYYNGSVYAGQTQYTSGYGQVDYRGLVEVHLATGVVTYHRPTYCSDDTHNFGRPTHLRDGILAVVHMGYGVALFDTVAKTWQLFSNSTLAGMTVGGVDLYAEAQICFDETNEMIMVGDSGDDHGVIMFSINGYIRQANYRIGTDPGGGWSFAAAAQLVQGYLDYDAAAAVEPGSSTAMYVFWTNETPDGEQSNKWDKDGSDLNLASYLVAGTEVAFDRGIDGKPATLNFTVSNGHLFDPYNQASLLSLYLRKGRKLTLRFGEQIGWSNYWENQGIFFVTATSLQFRRGDYPVMEVEAEDARAIWAHAHIVATEEYNNLGEDILEDLMQDEAGMDVADLNFPAMGGPLLSIQWIDTFLDEIVTQICNRLGHFFRYDMDGKASARPISNIASLDHTYTGNADLLAYSPDDKYSDFTNRVTVQGQELSFTTITFNEERVSQISGTLGWWGCKADHVVWFSDDKSRRCVNPRMNILEDARSIPFQLSGSVNITLVECGTADDYKFCTVHVSAPDLTPQLVSAISMIGTGLALGDYAPPVGGMTIPVGKIIEKAGLIWALMILGSTANYQIEIWAQPLGSVRRSVQATWNDEEHQTEIGSIVPAMITDPLCYSPADCLEVATFEGMVVQMQRKRVSLTKVAHLQDEEGDTIRRVHPYSGQNIDLFVARLRRSLIIPAPGEDGGQFIDEIEGWVVN